MISGQKISPKARRAYEDWYAAKLAADAVLCNQRARDTWDRKGSTGRNGPITDQQARILAWLINRTRPSSAGQVAHGCEVSPRSVVGSLSGLTVRGHVRRVGPAPSPNSRAVWLYEAVK